MPIYSDEAQGLIHGPFRKHMGRPEDRTPLGSSVGLGSFGDVLRLRETQAIADGREADYSEAESLRRSAEVLRNMAEEGRQEAETARETAESGRKDAETARVAAETSRDNAETARASAESARITAESDRQTAEAGRVQAELEREAGKITSASVSVDDNVGTPEATVTLGPPSSGGRSISFDFRNLKGDPMNLVPITNGQIDTIAGDGTITNDNVLTGTGLTYLWNWVKSKFASLVNGAVQIVQGGTGATTASGARNSLGVPTASSIASVESVTATANHAVGDYFMLGDVLMKATAAIATGETISASNATPATVQSQINTLVARYATEIRDNNRLLFQAKPDEHNTISLVYNTDTGSVSVTPKVNDSWLGDITMAVAQRGQLTNGQSVSFTLTSTTPKFAMLARQSANVGCVICVDWWTSQPLIIGNCPSSIVVTKSASSGSCTITNGIGGALSYLIIG